MKIKLSEETTKQLTEIVGEVNPDMFGKISERLINEYWINTVGFKRDVEDTLTKLANSDKGIISILLAYSEKGNRYLWMSSNHVRISITKCPSTLRWMARFTNIVKNKRVTVYFDLKDRVVTSLSGDIVFGHLDSTKYESKIKISLIEPNSQVVSEELAKFLEVL